MGGYNSSRWHDHKRRATVEQCLQLPFKDVHDDMPDFDDEKMWGVSSTFQWQRRGRTYSVDLRVTGKPLMVIRFTANGQQVEQVIRYTHQTRHLGGKQWYWHCPKCQRRVLKLYLPMVSGHDPRFYCRTCHDLTYRSAQTAHEQDRGVFGDLGRVMVLQRRAEKLTNKLSRTRPGSKNHDRLCAQLEKIMRQMKEIEPPSHF